MKASISTRVYFALLTASVIPSFLALGLLYYLLSAHDHLVQNHLQNINRNRNPVTSSFRSLLQEKRMRFVLQGKLLGVELEKSLSGKTPEEHPGILETTLEQTPEIAEIAVFPPGSVSNMRNWLDPEAGPLPIPIHQVERPVLLTQEYRHLSHFHETAAFDIRVLLAAPVEDITSFQQLANNYEESVHILGIYQGIRKYYWTIFFFALLAIVGSSYLAASAILKRMTRTIRQLATATRSIAEGQLDVTVPPRAGRDELSVLVRDFNSMVREIAAGRQKIRYLERMGAWQEVARRLAHEIKNPLTPILLAVQQIHEKAPRDNPKFSRLVDTAVHMVREEVADLQKLVEAFGSLARLPDLQVQTIPVDDFVRELLELAEITWGKKRIELLGTVPPDTHLLADRMLLKRAILNVIENAVHAQTGNEKPVLFSVSRDKKTVSFFIEDSGEGVADTELIFEPYYTTKPQGTGLGLPLAKKIILDHEGDIQAESLSTGTRMVIRLPIGHPPESRN